MQKLITFEWETPVSGIVVGNIHMRNFTTNKKSIYKYIYVHIEYASKKLEYTYVHARIGKY